MAEGFWAWRHSQFNRDPEDTPESRLKPTFRNVRRGARVQACLHGRVLSKRWWPAAGDAFDLTVVSPHQLTDIAARFDGATVDCVLKSFEYRIADACSFDALFLFPKNVSYE